MNARVIARDTNQPTLPSSRQIGLTSNGKMRASPTRICYSPASIRKGDTHENGNCCRFSAYARWRLRSRRDRASVCGRCGGQGWPAPLARAWALALAWTLLGPPDLGLSSLAQPPGLRLSVLVTGQRERASRPLLPTLDDAQRVLRSA